MTLYPPTLSLLRPLILDCIHCNLWVSNHELLISVYLRWVTHVSDGSFKMMDRRRVLRSHHAERTTGYHNLSEQHWKETISRINIIYNVLRDISKPVVSHTPSTGYIIKCRYLLWNKRHVVLNQNVQIGKDLGFILVLFWISLFQCCAFFSPNAYC